MSREIVCLWYIGLVVLYLLVVPGPYETQGLRYYTKQRMLELREKVREMFQHAYDGYLRHASDYDELRPLTCDGVDTWGSYSLTLIDALDTLATMGNFTEFRRVARLIETMEFDKDINVSVFETNIRIVGGLLSAHLMAKRAGMKLEQGWPCQGPLLRQAEDVARRLLPAFDTATGMPYGTVNLRYGVPKGETSVTCTAGVGTFLVEFGALSRLTGNPIYEEVALNAIYTLWERRSTLGLFGNHIDVQTGRWTALDSGIGAGVDSLFEYLVKGAILLNRPILLEMFHDARSSIDKYLKRDDWYVWVNMNKGQITLPVFQSLEAFWPGLLSLTGDIGPAMRTLVKYSSVWRKYGFLPEFFNIALGEASPNRETYPLRPELIESAMYLYRATGNQFLLELGEDMLNSIEFSAKTRCGYATIRNVITHEKENRMESFYLAETTKYLYMLFDPQNFLHNDGGDSEILETPNGHCAVQTGPYIFNTEAHPIDMSALYCCHNIHDDIFDGLDLNLYSEEILLKTERDMRFVQEALNDEEMEYACNEETDYASEQSTATDSSNAGGDKAKSCSPVDIEVFDENNNPAGDILVENFERIRLERKNGVKTGTAEARDSDTLSANHLTVTDLNEFFSMRREHFTNAELALNYVTGFMLNYTLDSTFITGLQLLDKNLTSSLGTIVQKEYESRTRTLWELYEMQQEYKANAELMRKLGILSFDDDDRDMLDRILHALNHSGALPAVEEDAPLRIILQQMELLRSNFQRALVNTTAMQEFLLKILINGTSEKKRSYTALLDELEISELPLQTLSEAEEQKVFGHVRRVVEFKKRMIETFDRLQTLMTEGNMQFSSKSMKTAYIKDAITSKSDIKAQETQIAASSTNAAQSTAADKTTQKSNIQNEKNAVAETVTNESGSVWSQLVQTILRKTTQQRYQFDEAALLEKTRKSLQMHEAKTIHISNLTAKTKMGYEVFTCQRPSFVERFAYREHYP